MKDKINYFLPTLLQNLILFLENMRWSSSFVANRRKVGGTQIQGTSGKFLVCLSHSHPCSSIVPGSKDLSQTTDWRDAGRCNLLEMEGASSDITAHSVQSLVEERDRGRTGKRGKSWTSMMIQFTAVQSSCQSLPESWAEENARGDHSLIRGTRQTI